jgi:hypothetical protein
MFSEQPRISQHELLLLPICFCCSKNSEEGWSLIVHRRRKSRKGEVMNNIREVLRRNPLFLTEIISAPLSTTASTARVQFYGRSLKVANKAY